MVVGWRRSRCSQSAALVHAERLARERKHGGRGQSAKFSVGYFLRIGLPARDLVCLGEQAAACCSELDES